MIQQYRFSANMENKFDCFKHWLKFWDAVMIMMLVVSKEIIRKIKYQPFQSVRNSSGAPQKWLDPKTNLGLGPIFMPTTKEAFWHQKLLCGNWQAKEKHTRNYQLVGWRVNFFSTYQRLGTMSQRKRVFSGTHCFHIQILKPHLNFSNPHSSPIHAAPTT